MYEHEGLKDGEVICKIEPELIEKFKALTDQRIVIQQFLDNLMSRQIALNKVEKELWEEVKKRYLLGDTKNYFIDFTTYELKSFFQKGRND